MVPQSEKFSMPSLPGTSMVRCFPREMNRGRAMISSAPSSIITGMTSSILGSLNSLYPMYTLP